MTKKTAPKKAGPKKPSPADAGKVFTDAKPLDPIGDPIEDPIGGPAAEDPKNPFSDRPRAVETLPPTSPVEALGVRGDVCFYLDVNRQIVELKAKDHSRLGLYHLFGKRNECLQVYFPALNTNGKVKGTDFQEAARILLRDCSNKGTIDPNETLRGRGAWRDDDGRLVLHCGKKILIGPPLKDEDPQRFKPKVIHPGPHGSHIYPGGGSIGLPIGPPQGRARSRQPGQDLFGLVKTWPFTRGDIDVFLLVGWIAAAFLSGALDWRAMVWVTGKSGSGKSTLHKLIKGVLLDWVVSTSDTTAAGLWQKIGYDALPIAVDEIEAEEHNDKAQKVIALARQASSGGTIFRGGSGHMGSQFRIRSAFLFSSILIPPLASQDKSRLAILKLGLLPPGSAMPDLDPERLGQLGGNLLDHLWRQWWRWEPTLRLYRDALLGQGHSARAADQFGTLLAAADLAMAGGMNGVADQAHNLAHELRPAVLSDTDGLDGNEIGCLNWLLGSAIQVDREPMTVGDALTKAYHQRYYSPDDAFIGRDEDTDKSFEKVNQILAGHGVKFFETKEGSPDGATPQVWVAIAKEHVGLSAIFKGSHWPGKAGAEGVWVQALERIPDTIVTRHAVRFGGPRPRAVLIPVGYCVEVEDRRNRAAIQLGGGQLASPDQGGEDF